MRVMEIVKANDDSASGKMPDLGSIAEMGNFNEELAMAGVLLEADGLYPSSCGKRVRFGGDERMAIDGPFPETKDLIAGLLDLECGLCRRSCRLAQEGAFWRRFGCGDPPNCKS